MNGFQNIWTKISLPLKNIYLFMWNIEKENPLTNDQWFTPHMYTTVRPGWSWELRTQFKSLTCVTESSYCSHSLLNPRVEQEAIGSEQCPRLLCEMQLSQPASPSKTKHSPLTSSVNSIFPWIFWTTHITHPSATPYDFSFSIRVNIKNIKIWPHFIKW